ncbi:MAG: hypothetical protein ACR2O4_16170 [Hyphomicrobiaceae bacterium]
MLRTTACRFAGTTTLAVLTFFTLPETAAVAQSDDDAKWQYQRYRDQNNGRERADLIFGVPETDATAFVASCNDAPKNEKATIILSADDGDRSNGSRLRVRFRSQGFSRTYRGDVYRTNSEAGSVRVAVALDDRLWREIANDRSMTFNVVGERSVKMHLRGSSRQVRKFRDECRQFNRDARERGPERVVEYSCNEGIPLTVRYDRRDKKVVYMSHDSFPEVALKRRLRFFGKRYKGGKYRLRIKKSKAILKWSGSRDDCLLDG